jgi:ankyrin repeat protein
MKLLLLRDDIDLDFKNSDDRTPLSLTAENGHEKVMKLLLTKNDVDLNSKNKNGRTPLSRIVRKE